MPRTCYSQMKKFAIAELKRGRKERRLELEVKDDGVMWMVNYSPRERSEGPARPRDALARGLSSR